jgi:hypothetical protein
LQNCGVAEIIIAMTDEASKDKFLWHRHRMAEQDLKGRGITDPGVLSVMGRLAREE